MSWENVGQYSPDVLVTWFGDDEMKSATESNPVFSGLSAVRGNAYVPLVAARPVRAEALGSGKSGLSPGTTPAMCTSVIRFRRRMTRRAPGVGDQCGEVSTLWGCCA